MRAEADLGLLGAALLEHANEPVAQRDVQEHEYDEGDRHACACHSPPSAVLAWYTHPASATSPLPEAPPRRIAEKLRRRVPLWLVIPVAPESRLCRRRAGQRPAMPCEQR